MKYLAAFLVLFLTACNGGGGGGETWSGKVNVPRGQWVMAYGTPNPTLVGMGFDFKHRDPPPLSQPVPTISDEPHYMIFGHYGKITGSSITIRYKVTGGPLEALEGGISGTRRLCPGKPAQIAIFIQRTGDTMTANPLFRTYRAWSKNRPELRAGTHRLTVSLTHSNWVAVSGQHDANSMAALLADVQHYGVTFGGCGGAGHGVRALNDATFELLEFRVN